MNSPPVSRPWRIDRRDFLRVSAAVLAGLALGGRGRLSAAPAEPRPVGLRFGLLTDAHYADADPKGTRFYRESLAKVREAVDRLRIAQVDFLAELGDLKDMAPGESAARTLAHLVAIEAELRRFGGPVIHVLGNHDLDNLAKAEVLAATADPGAAPRGSYHAFSRGGVRFLVTDANFRKDGRDYDHGNFDWRDNHVPPAELAWLHTELAAAGQPVIVLAHQRLDGTGDPYVVNSAEVRAALEASGKVLAVFQGHDHEGGLTRLNGIHYYTLKAVIEGSGAENNAYAMVTVHPDLNLSVIGYRRAVSAELPRQIAPVPSSSEAVESRRAE